MDCISVTVKEAGRLLGLPRTAIYLQLREKRLDSFKCGRRRLITVASLQRFVDEQVAQANNVKLNPNLGGCA